MENPHPASILDRETDDAPTRPLRILHLEDSPHDRDFVQRALAKAGIPCEFVYADGEEEFHRALEQGGIELILSDFTLPGYGGAEALAYAQAKHPDLPYLFVSGTIGEERAVESLKGGVIDYVLKSNLSRLPTAVRAAMREVGERLRRHRAEEALRESEQRFREMASNIRDVFWIAASGARRLLYVSPGFEQIWGRSITEVHARPDLWLDSIHPEDQARVLAALDTLADGRDVAVEYRIVRPDGAMRWIENRAYPSRGDAAATGHAVGVAADITDRKQLQEQLLQAQKMEALGQLAGGVAHDFNNLLTVINGYAGLLLVHENLPEELTRPLQQICSAGERATNLTRQLLVFSRKGTLRLKPLELNTRVEETVKMLGRLIGENIKLTLSLAPGLPRVEADEGMIEQLLMNLAVNARDAMPAGGKLTLRTEACSFDAREARSRPSRRAGDFVHVSVSDTGGGIAPEVLPRVFEPFFTTKKAGEGTGLGLAMVFGIVENHRGWLEVDSHVGEGTTFHVYLPAILPVAPVASAAASATATPTTPTASAATTAPASATGGTETILLVEDEQSVREFGRAVLQHFGYRVLQASSAREALEVWKWHSSRIRLLLTDMVLPDDISGLELAKKLRAESPSLKVICASGYTRERLDRLAPAQENIHFLQKPYQPQTLAKAVRDCLNQ